ncbi:MAG: triose-phosphate isomerase [Bacteroidia bacterium]|nr:triose-phosphate isomerase [Bacteroidia bacterium]
MRKKIVAGNWKMNNGIIEGLELARSVEQSIGSRTNNGVKVVLAPPFIHLPLISKIIDPGRIALAAQNCASEAKGAFTGEVSALMIKSAGADYVIIGHSERRTYFGETDSALLRKVRLTLENNLIPIFCIGEHLSDRQAGHHFRLIRAQLENSVFHLKTEELSKLVIAYEPVWAIGTGVNATPEQAQEMHFYIRSLISEKFDKIIADDLSILYGGSCKASNARELFVNPDVDGGLIGGASLIASEFADIVYSF